MSSSLKKIEFGKELTRLCKAGRLNEGLSLYRQMRANEIDLSHWNLSALLNGCLKNEKKSKKRQYLRIWQEVVINDGVKPNFVCYSTAIRCAQICSDYESQIFFGHKLKKNYIEFMTNYHWNRVIESLLKMKKTKTALDTFKEMKMRRMAPSKHTISILLNGLIKNEQFAEFEAFVFSEVNFDNLQFDNFVFTNFAHGMNKCGNAHFVKFDFLPFDDLNINALTVGLCAAKQSKNEKMCDLIVCKMKKKENFCKISPFIWNEIISAFGSLGKFDKMWREYGEYRRVRCVEEPNFDILTTVCSMEQRLCFKENALNEAVPFFDFMPSSSLKHFYRAALSLNKFKIAKDIRLKMSQKKDEKKERFCVVARFESEKKQIFVKNDDNFYDYLVDELIESINYKISINEYAEFENFFGAHNFIKYHAEKKALAFLLKNKVQNIEIFVNMRMCRDCHSFFEAVSKHFSDAKIECTDSRKKHKFENGQCSVCNAQSFITPTRSC